MSLQSWKDEFYPKEPTKRMTKVAALKHSIQKWTGLLPKNLEKHGLEKVGRWISEKENAALDFFIDSNTCALCVRFLNENPNGDEHECKKCPLFKSYITHPCEGEGSKYAAWIRRENPRPMLRALKATLKKVEAGEL